MRSLGLSASRVRCMTIPETTSAEALNRYYGGKCLIAGRGKAWREVKASVFVQPSPTGMVQVPSINEPLLLWVLSGGAEIQDREMGRGPWITSRVKKGDFFLTVAGAPYECRWKLLEAEPFQFMLVSIELSVLQRALEEVLGADSSHARLRDVSGFADAALNGLMERLHGELLARKASALYVQGIAQALAVHLVRKYVVTDQGARSGSAALPGHKLRQITNWMADHVTQDCDLDQLATQAGFSKFHFHRLFKNAMGVSPLQYHINLRMDVARRLLRETKMSVLSVAVEVGYATPSHFAHLFRRETGLCPSDYRRQR